MLLSRQPAELRRQRGRSERAGGHNARAIRKGLGFFPDQGDIGMGLYTLGDPAGKAVAVHR